jgi:very-short-patch-repair endonuclease
VVEVDGPIHQRQRDQDTYREKVISARGLTILRITNEEVRTDIDRVLSRILRAIEAPLPFREGAGG